LNNIIVIIKVRAHSKLKILAAEANGSYDKLHFLSFVKSTQPAGIFGGEK